MSVREVKRAPKRRPRPLPWVVPVTEEQLGALEWLEDAVGAGGNVWSNRRYVAGLRRILGRRVVDRARRMGRCITVEV